jgi:hypothetical protein
MTGLPVTAATRERALCLAKRIRALDKKGVRFYVSSYPESVAVFPPMGNSVVLRTWMTEEQVEEIITRVEAEWKEKELSPCMETLAHILGPVLIQCKE